MLIESETSFPVFIWQSSPTGMLAVRIGCCDVHFAVWANNWQQCDKIYDTNKISDGICDCTPGMQRTFCFSKSWNVIFLTMKRHGLLLMIRSKENFAGYHGKCDRKLKNISKNAFSWRNSWMTPRRNFWGNPRKTFLKNLIRRKKNSLRSTRRKFYRNARTNTLRKSRCDFWSILKKRSSFFKIDQEFRNILRNTQKSFKRNLQRSNPKESKIIPIEASWEI